MQQIITWLCTFNLSLVEIFSLLFIHYIADFIFQDEKWAVGKSKNITDLLSHTIMYSGIWLFIGTIIVIINYKMQFCTISQWNMVIFVIITFICHTITDFFTSKLVSKKFENQQYGSPIPNLGAFSLIGFDQCIHYLQLFITYSLLFK
jgi:uncharacterized protein YacL